MKCDRCGKDIPEGQGHTHEGKTLCEACRIHVGLYPLGHTGHFKKSFYIKDIKH